ncbi:hypothetical protein ACN08Z_06935 [Rothia sp. P7181]|uniref:hypothetical protein n=1 Tax=Rothia sp. P7181 TaxID=3402663 RepID=UPI003AD8AB20
MVSSSRRYIVKSALWSAPAVIATTAIPAYAGSPGSNPDLRWESGPSNVGRFTWDRYWPRVSMGGCSVKFSHVNPGDTFQGLQQTFWLPDADLRFHRAYQSSMKWSLLEREYGRSLRSISKNGKTQTLYPYTTRWVGGDLIVKETSCTARDGCYCLVGYRYFAYGANYYPGSYWYGYYHETSMSVNGEGLVSKETESVHYSAP